MRLVFAGTGDIGVPTLEWLLASRQALGLEVTGVVTQPDKPVGRHQTLTASAIKDLALRAGLPVQQPLKMRDPEAVEALRTLRPDVLVVMAYGQILPKSVLDLPKVACLNLHASLLPLHRGAAPIQAAIQAGDAESGITVMYMAEGLDTGDVLLKKPLRLRRRETGGSLHDRLGLLAPGALAEALELLSKGTAPRTPQNNAEATYAGKLLREHGLISWESAPAVDRRVRAMNPWPGAYTVLPGWGGHPERKLKVYSVIQSRTESGGGVPGTVLAVEKRGLLVAAGDRSVWLTEVQLEGKKRLQVAEFLRGTAVPEGIVLGAAALP
ncbi:MAG: methionyl-tRNA formyltransferase [Verrucomicrobia bacterium]|nr:MAG: methionyl-tRNA formyltransferase [Verrucomicrobiota bacterium]